jgi:tetratricopeptide (TPR) repeat protein
MASYVQIVQRLPQEWQMTMVELVEAVERQLREQLAVRREDVEALSAEVRKLAQAQKRTEVQVGALAEAQARTEATVQALVQAQARTEEELRQYREASEARFARIEAALDRLAEAQARTEATVQALVQAQARMEEEFRQYREASEARFARIEAALNRLAEAQARTEERVTRLEDAVVRLEEAVARLLEAQARTEERVTRLEAALERLAAAQEQMARQLGALSNLLGADLEVDAEEVLAHVMRQKGYRPVGPPYPMEVDGEIDVAVLLESPEGTPIWALIEVKARLRKGDVEWWGKRLRDPEFLRRLAGVRIEPPYLPYAFGLRVYPDAEDLAREMGIGVLDSRGERAEARPL